MQLYLICRIFEAGDQDYLLTPTDEIPFPLLSGPSYQGPHVCCKNNFIFRKIYIWQLLQQHRPNVIPTWRLPLFLVWAPCVRAGLQHRWQQQQCRFFPLIAVSWRQVTVRKLTQPFNKGWRSGTKKNIKWLHFICFQSPSSWVCQWTMVACKFKPQHHVHFLLLCCFIKSYKHSPSTWNVLPGSWIFHTTLS